MPLNKLENFIKNAEGRILYVNPNDLDSTDGIENQGNSLTKPFKTIQRALIESARFSYVEGSDNDITEKTTILVFPGEHLIDNRPGFAVKSSGGNAIAVHPNGSEFNAQELLTLTLDSNFDLTQEDNILYKFNSINGGIIIPRGTSVVGLDLRKTKVRPKYVPNPTDVNVPSSAIFRITGACYFWQFSFFDGDETGLVYTDPTDFSVNNQSIPTFSHHKITCFEYADGVNIPTGYQITDLDMYYSKLANAFNKASNREITEKFPGKPDGFAKQRPEFEIVGAFASDPITISEIISGDGATPGTVVTVTTQNNHNLNAGTPIKIKNINVSDYNISTKVAQVLSATKFTYFLQSVRANLPAGPAAGLAPGAGASAIIETDTVTGASPYIFNVSLRSVFGIQGMHADGSKADGFRSMVVAQFTAVSLQKDDRAFVKYNKTNRQWSSGLDGNVKVTGQELSAGSSAINNVNVLHLDSDAVYRDGWKTTHIKMSNDAIIQVVSVFAIGFHKHFECLSGGDASITNSNSNFGQFSLASDGFKNKAFSKDDKGFITGVVTPKSITSPETDVEWVQFDGSKITNNSDAQRLYLLGYTTLDIKPPAISQGYRLGARVGEKIYLDDDAKFAEVLMTDVIPTSTTDVCTGSDTSAKVYENVVITVPLNDSGTTTIYNTTSIHNLQNGESIRIFSETGDLPEGLEEGKLYYAVTASKNNSRTDGVNLLNNQFQIAASKTNADAVDPIYITSYLGEQLRVESRVSDKKVGETGHPIQYDYVVGNWFIYVKGTNNDPSSLKNYLANDVSGDSEISYFKRVEDGRSLDEKIYKLRYVVPKELENGRDPVSGFIIQDSSSVNVRSDSDFTKTEISITADPANNVTPGEYDFDRNPRFIEDCTYNASTNTSAFVAERDHDLKINDIVEINNVTSTNNTSGKENFGFNGSFKVVDTPDSKTFTVSNEDNPGTATFNSDTRTKSIPTFRRSDAQENLYVYRVEVITPYIKDIQDGVFYLYVLNANNAITQPSGTFDNIKYSQNTTDLYPQLDRDNFDSNPPSAATFAKRTPLGEVVTNDLKRSITRETTDKFFKTFSFGNEITNVSDSGTSATLTVAQDHGLSGITGFNVNNLTNGANHGPDGTYHNVRLINNNVMPPSNLEDLYTVWDGATATVIVSSGTVTDVSITEFGSGYTNNETLYFDARQIGGTANARIDITTGDIIESTNDYIQVTGIGTATGGYYKISTTSNKRQIGIAKTVGDPQINAGEYVTVVGKVGTGTIDNNVFTSTKGVGVVKGNKVRLLDSSNNNLGDYIVVDTPNSKTFTISSTTTVTGATQFMKHALSDNNNSDDDGGENIGSRLYTFYDNQVLYTTQSVEVAADKFSVENPDGSTTESVITSRFPLGSYIQIGNEIMRVKSSSLTGNNNDQLQVIRGSMGTIIETHSNNSLVKKIKLAPIELRRPSILRASGHTFEYLGYGPGNYSTGLPQVQVKTLSENEEFLSQSQETACGTVLYTGMDSDGDFYIGNTKYSAQSGEQQTFDVPTPTVTGEDPNRLSVVFDEVVVKERILVEGGKSKQILSQFDGPITFNGDVRMNKKLVLNNELRVIGKVDFQSTTDATSCTDANAALRVAGGVAIGKRLFVCDSTDINGGLDVAGVATFQTGIIPDTDEGAYIGTANKPWSEAHIDEIVIGETNNTVTTATGNLILDSNAGTVDINDQLTVSGITKFESNQDNTIGNVNTGAVQLDGGMGIALNLSVGGKLDVDGDTTLDGLTSHGSISITSGSLTITDGDITLNGSGKKVTASRFEGTADVANKIKINAISNYGDENTELQPTKMQVVLTDVNNVNNRLFTKNLLEYNSSTKELNTPGDIVAFFTSDERLKDNVTAIDDPLAKVLSLGGYTFDWNENTTKEGTETGVIAQEIESMGLPGLVTTRDDGYKAVRYEKLVPLLIEAIKELNDKISSIQKCISSPTNDQINN